MPGKTRRPLEDDKEPELHSPASAGGGSSSGAAAGASAPSSSLACQLGERSDAKFARAVVPSTWATTSFTTTTMPRPRNLGLVAGELWLLVAASPEQVAHASEDEVQSRMAVGNETELREARCRRHRLCDKSLAGKEPQLAFAVELGVGRRCHGLPSTLL